jgi:hypothetical protein
VIAVAETVEIGENASLVFHLVNAVSGNSNELLQYEGRIDTLAGLAWSPDGRFIAFGLMDDIGVGWARLHLVDLDTLEVISLWEPIIGLRILGWTADSRWLAIRSGRGEDGFLHTERGCWITPTILEGMWWRAFSGQSNHLLVSYQERTYILDLNEVLGSDFPEGVLSCP